MKSNDLDALFLALIVPFPSSSDLFTLLGFDSDLKTNIPVSKRALKYDDILIYRVIYPRLWK